MYIIFEFVKRQSRRILNILASFPGHFHLNHLQEYQLLDYSHPQIPLARRRSGDETTIGPGIFSLTTLRVIVIV